jgi:CubicO group peptidase (beta-lactamase class C family)
MLRLGVLIVCFVNLLAQIPSSADRPVGSWRQYANAVDGGFDEEALARARAAAEAGGSGAVFVVHHGRVVAAWGDPARPYFTRSIRKSIVDVMFGEPAIQKRLRLDATLADFGIDDREGLTPTERTATVDHLLAARSGVYHPAAREPLSMTKNRPVRGSAAPGTQWFYNNWDFNALGTIYARLAGTDIVTGFERSLAQPLQFDDYKPGEGFLIREPSKSRHAAYEFPLSARDLARIGQLVLQQGRWNGTQTVAADWLAQSMRIRSPFPVTGGYAHLWWIDASGFRTRGASHPGLDAVHDIAATGLGGQLLLIAPSLQLVIVHLTESDDAADDLAFRIADMIVQARRGEPRPSAGLMDVRPGALGAARPARPQRQAIALLPASRDVVGEYSVTPAVRAVVRYIDGGLFVDMTGRGEAEMFQEAPDRFFLKVTDVTLTVERDAAGKVTGLNVIDRGRAITARKVG